MNWDRIEGRWKQLTGQLTTRWGRWLHSEARIAMGQRRQLVGRIQKRYGMARDDMAKQASSACSRRTESPPLNDLD
jgi:uncharacterized protein YjbJ (UPF0337 family)